MLAIECGGRCTHFDGIVLEGPLVDLGILLSREDCDLKDLSLTMGVTGFCNAHSFECFAEGLKANHSLCKLRLGRLHLSDELAESLAGAFQQPSALQEVDILGAKLTDRGLSFIGKALLAIPSLKFASILDYSCHVGKVTITAETAAFLVKLMETNYSFEDFRFVPKDCTSLELQNRQYKVDVYCILNRAGLQTYIERPSSGASEGLEIELSILAQVNKMQLPRRRAASARRQRVNALYASVVMMAQSFAAIPE